MSAAFQLESQVGQVGEDVRHGLSARHKTLPPYLLYDEAGSALYEQITVQDEYYLTRAERQILEAHADDIVALASSPARPLGLVELGAGSAEKTQVVLRAVLARQGRCHYVPIDVSASAMTDAQARLALAMPEVDVAPLVMTHELAIARLGALPSPQLVLFLGSSVGNFPDHEAAAILRGLRHALGGGASILLGTDLPKSPRVLVPAYDDAAGVTAAFNKNLLRRINRELGGHFDLARFRHLARWNAGASCMEMHLQSTERQDVAIDAIGLVARFDAGETIHTESSIKYDVPRVERLLDAGGFALRRTFYDTQERYAVHLASVGGV